MTKPRDEEIYAISIFLDLSKAFDIVNHSLLLSKLELDVYGTGVIENQQFRSYLTKRKQEVLVNGFEVLEVSLGEHQGSIVGPALFLVYILNNIVSSTKYFSTLVFADDTSITVTGEDLNLLQLVNFELPSH